MSTPQRPKSKALPPTPKNQSPWAPSPRLPSTAEELNPQQYYHSPEPQSQPSPPSTSGSIGYFRRFSKLRAQNPDPVQAPDEPAPVLTEEPELYDSPPPQILYLHQGRASPNPPPSARILSETVGPHVTIQPEIASPDGQPKRKRGVRFNLGGIVVRGVRRMSQGTVSLARRASLGSGSEGRRRGGANGTGPNGGESSTSNWSSSPGTATIRPPPPQSSKSFTPLDPSTLHAGPGGIFEPDLANPIRPTLVRPIPSQAGDDGLSSPVASPPPQWPPSPPSRSRSPPESSGTTSLGRPISPTVHIPVESKRFTWTQPTIAISSPFRRKTRRVPAPVVDAELIAEAQAQAQAQAQMQASSAGQPPQPPRQTQSHDPVAHAVEPKGGDPRKTVHTVPVPTPAPVALPSTPSPVASPPKQRAAVPTTIHIIRGQPQPRRDTYRARSPAPFTARRPPRPRGSTSPPPSPPPQASIPASIPRHASPSPPSPTAARATFTSSPVEYHHAPRSNDSHGSASSYASTTAYDHGPQPGARAPIHPYSYPDPDQPLPSPRPSRLQQLRSFAQAVNELPWRSRDHVTVSYIPATAKPAPRAGSSAARAQAQLGGDDAPRPWYASKKRKTGAPGADHEKATRLRPPKRNVAFAPPPVFIPNPSGSGGLVAVGSITTRRTAAGKGPGARRAQYRVHSVNGGGRMRSSDGSAGEPVPQNWYPSSVIIQSSASS